MPLRRVLLLLDRPRPMREIAAQLACDPSYITGLADQLEGRGLARRTAGSDRRVKLLAATDAGTAIRHELAAAVARRAFGRQLSPDERGVLRDLLTRLRDG
ncbi:MarR family winged helix-turn-helix transcriptional regulator [Microbacterium sp. gxy059]|uniref:MarR family winged helix-turn-helix transcriptional regulator n=1 Tax=Microbacterium sp. gxy059 TaxID=2957199 RepID=UPI003D9939D1